LRFLFSFIIFDCCSLFFLSFHCVSCFLLFFGWPSLYESYIADL